MAKRAKASCTYRYFSVSDAEILGITQGSSASIILQSTALSRTAKSAAAASSARRHMYNNREDSNAEDKK